MSRQNRVYAKVIADSMYDGGYRLTTMEVCFHRFVLAEVNTHRVFSRNSASSRAIPLAKQISKVEHNPAEPVSWPEERKGMQGGAELGPEDTRRARDAWAEAADDMVIRARRLGAIGVHKSVVNRLLEPFLMHTAVITSTAWENFFRLRLDPLAQPEIRVAAEMMKAAYDDSVPLLLEPGQWHLPYLLKGEARQIAAEGFDLRHISSARCARTSYETQAGTRDLNEDVRLYGNLTANGHASPLEHVATPAPWNIQRVDAANWNDPTAKGITLTLPEYGNLLGWHSHRFDVEAERGYQAFS